MHPRTSLACVSPALAAPGLRGPAEAGPSAVSYGNCNVPRAARLILDAVTHCACVVRPDQMTPSARRYTHGTCTREH